MQKNNLLRTILLLIIPLLLIVPIIIFSIAGSSGGTGAPGVSIVSVIKTSSSGNVDTYTITYSDGKTSTFNVTNGTQGQPGPEGHSPEITINPENGHWMVDGVDTGVDSEGAKGDTGISITSTQINEDGDLIVTFSDGSSVNAGHLRDIYEFTVRFHLDGRIIRTLAVEKNSKLTEPSTAYTAGYTISDWYTTDGVVKASWNFDEFVVVEDVDIYADFERNIYKIKFLDLKNGVSVSDKNVYFNQPYAIQPISYEGYDFVQWLDEKGNPFSSEGVYTIASDITLYASWETKKSLVTLNPNGGQVEYDTLKIEYNDLYKLPTPTLTGRKFVGWFDEANNRISQEAIWKSTENITLLAKWSDENQKYYFDAGEGACDLSQIELTDGELYELPTPYFSHYVFDGWYLDDELIAQSGVWSSDYEGRVFKAAWHSEYLSYELIDDKYAVSECDRSAEGIIIIYNNYLGISVESVEEEAFNNCRKISSVFIQDGLKNISKSAFKCCYKLSTISLPESIISIDDHAFYYCTSLSEIVLPNNISKISNNLFAHCTSLESITFSKSVKYIEASVSDCCNMFKTINFKGTLEDWLLININASYNDILLAATVVYTS